MTAKDIKFKYSAITSDQELILKYSKDKDYRILANVARNKNTSEAILLTLIDDKNKKFKCEGEFFYAMYSLAENENITKKIIIKLLNLKDDQNGILFKCIIECIKKEILDDILENEADKIDLERLQEFKDLLISYKPRRRI